MNNSTSEHVQETSVLQLHFLHSKRVVGGGWGVPPGFFLETSPSSSILAPSNSGSMAEATEARPLLCLLQQYVEAGAFLVLEFALHKPFVPKRLPEELAIR